MCDLRVRRAVGAALLVCAVSLGSLWALPAHGQLCDQTPPANGTVVATPASTSVALSWSGFSDSGTGLACTNAYKLVFAVGAPPADCNAGSVLFQGTGTSFTHTGLTPGVTYGYRVCATDNVANVSTGASASATTTGAPPPTQWSRAAGASLDDRGVAVAADGVNAYYTGHFTGTINLGGLNLTSGGANAQNVYLAKYDTAGAHQWSMRFSGTANDDGRGLTTDSAGNVIAVGLRTSPTIDFGGGNQFGFSGSDIFIVKYSGAGVYQWAKTFGGNGADYANAVAVDASGNVIVVGIISDSIAGVDLGCGPISIANSFSDAFVAKYSPSGTCLWSKKLGGSSFDGATAVGVTASGDIVVGGYFNGSVDFGGGVLTSAGANDMFVVRLTGSSGAHVWSKRFGSTTADTLSALRVDASDNVYFTGPFTGAVDFGGGLLTSAGGNDMALVKLTSAGAHLWSRRFGSTSDDVSSALTLDASGNVSLAGYFTGIVDFGGGNLIAAGSTDGVIAKYDPSGTYLSARRFGSAQAQATAGIAALGSLYAITGYFQNLIDLGQGTFTSAGGFDIYLGVVTP